MSNRLVRLVKENALAFEWVDDRYVANLSNMRVSVRVHRKSPDSNTSKKITTIRLESGGVRTSKETNQNLVTYIRQAHKDKLESWL